ncbi:MAG TPA: bifunctional DNA-formamidopyrimidine glycosylase/DNA-(apurinic or apyrimidinic site) lyase [Lapillicoccus sp.]|uniref:bifunctional DNA-formamidopyrimidine glycosylase/DNA-(apurinic or apyrimidinic site) lyase n=1 Tax=Lapillicoccus sp. TaxID=1909287 RepID=UPI002F945C05
MPELPEVETVRRGLDAYVVGRRITSAEFQGARVVRRHLPGAADLAARVEGSLVVQARRRGKYLWLVLEAPDEHDMGLLMHLGMSGQLLVQPPDAPDEKHLHARFRFEDRETELRFVDQRTFGGVALAELDWSTGDGIPEPIAHIAPDPLEAAWDEPAVVARMKARSSGVKRCLLDQSLVSGIGNIYADEALWRAAIHGERPADRLTKPALHRLLGHAREVMVEALGQGGTSFDALYVNVNGSSGYFDRSLDAYGQEGRPCRRCGTPIRREAFMNRSSYSCPRCQPRPRTGRL